jgi:hypothetical protein
MELKMKYVLTTLFIIATSPAFAICDIGQDVGDFMNCQQEERDRKKLLEQQEELLEQQREMLEKLEEQR